MTIEELKALEQAATQGKWEVTMDDPCETGSAPFVNAELLTALRNLAPEILALVEAAQNLENGYRYGEGSEGVMDALAAFNAKLEAL